MKKYIAPVFLIVLFYFNSFAQDKWKIDPVHSSVQFEVTHLVVSTVTGKFTEFSGALETTGNTFENAKIEANLEVKSIDTENLTRDNHLKQDDFF
jgi:polyisoprenoid-binding protein YceI